MPSGRPSFSHCTEGWEHWGLETTHAVQFKATALPRAGLKSWSSDGERKLGVLSQTPAMALPGPLQAEHWFHPWLHGGSLTEQMGPLKAEKDSFLSIQPAGQGTWRSEVVTIPRGQVKQEQDELTSNHQPPGVLAAHQTASLQLRPVSEYCVNS